MPRRHRQCPPGDGIGPCGGAEVPSVEAPHGEEEHQPPSTAIGARRAKKRPKGIPDATPMSMFWGLPTMVAVEPMLEAMASAIR
jgi:hypothetical protein